MNSADQEPEHEGTHVTSENAAGGSSAEVQALVSARSYAAGMRNACGSTASATETLVAVLAGHAMQGPAVEAVTRAGELASQAAAAWDAVYAALDRQMVVKEAYMSESGAGDKDFLTDGASSPGGPAASADDASHAAPPAASADLAPGREPETNFDDYPELLPSDDLVAWEGVPGSTTSLLIRDPAWELHFTPDSPVSRFTLVNTTTSEQVKIPGYGGIDKAMDHALEYIASGRMYVARPLDEQGNLLSEGEANRFRF